MSLTHTINLAHICVSAFRTAERLKLLQVRNQHEQYFLKTKTRANKIAAVMGRDKLMMAKGCGQGRRRKVTRDANSIMEEVTGT